MAYLFEGRPGPAIAVPPGAVDTHMNIYEPGGHAMAPERMLWAANWPHPGVDPRPDNAMMRDTLGAWIGEDTIIRRILVDNPTQLY